jgi:hypothetical protein
MERRVKATVSLVDGVVFRQVSRSRVSVGLWMVLMARVGVPRAGGDRAALGMARRAGTMWLGCPPH